jgi:multidrug resistance efflux pump
VTVDAYVAGDRTPLSSHLSGYVRSVLVCDNQSVRAGDTIVQMVDDDLPRHGGGGRGRARSTRGTR